MREKQARHLQRLSDLVFSIFYIVRAKTRFADAINFNTLPALEYNDNLFNDSYYPAQIKADKYTDCTNQMCKLSLPVICKCFYLL